MEIITVKLAVPVDENVEIVRSISSVGLHGCSFHTSDFTKGQIQLSAEAIELTGALSSATMHVEH